MKIRRSRKRARRPATVARSHHLSLKLTCLIDHFYKHKKLPGAAHQQSNKSWLWRKFKIRITNVRIDCLRLVITAPGLTHQKKEKKQQQNVCA